MSDDAVLSTWTIYDHPRDAPNSIVLRRWRIVAGSRDPVPDDQVAVFDTVEQARDWLDRFHPGLYRIARQRGDDPKIVETWL